MMPFSAFNFPYLNWAVNLNGSTLSQGNLSTIAKVLLRLQEKRCLNVAVLGGSITAGSTLGGHKENGIFQPHGVEGAWPGWLKKYLDVYFPMCGFDNLADGHYYSGGHTVHNLAKPAVGSDYWVVKLMEVLGNKEHPNDFGKHISEADLIIIDTSINDSVDLGEKRLTSHLTANRTGLQNTQVHTEILINQLKALPNVPAVIFVGISEREVWKDRAAKPGVTQIAEAQAEVAAHYGISYVSAIHTLGPFVTEYQRSWFLNIFRADHFCHLSTVGHRFVASLVVRYILQSFLDHAMYASTNSVWPSVHTESTYEDASATSKGSLLEEAARERTYLKPPSVPYICQRSEIDLMVHANFLSVDATKQKPVYTSADWSVFEDVKGKPGLIAFNTGATAMFGFDAAHCERKNLTGMLKLQLLKSYKDMGVVNVRLFSVPGGRVAADCLRLGAVASSTKILGAERSIDCLWRERASVTVVETLQFPSSFDGCLCVNATITSTRAPHNKVKLLYLTVL
jgi:hypothetical protein